MKQTHSRAPARFRKMATLLGAAALALAPVAVQAQEVDLQRAEVLEAEAEALIANQAQWSDAAKMLKEAAHLRPEGDAQARKDLFKAARLAYYHGKEGRAVNDLAELADRALAEGDVLTAAQALADAAWIAHEEGMATRTVEYGERARRLALSPHLTQADRASLEQRFSVGG